MKPKVGLPKWILREFCTELSEPVCAMFNVSIREGVYCHSAGERPTCYRFL